MTVFAYTSGQLNGGLGYRVEYVSDSTLAGHAFDDAGVTALAAFLGVAESALKYNLDDFKAVERGTAFSHYEDRFATEITATLGGVSYTFRVYQTWLTQILVERIASSLFPFILHLSDGTKVSVTPTATEIASMIGAIRFGLRPAADALVDTYASIDALAAPGTPSTPPGAHIEP